MFKKDERSSGNTNNDIFKTFIHKKTRGLNLFTTLSMSSKDVKTNTGIF